MYLKENLLLRHSLPRLLQKDDSRLKFHRTSWTSSPTSEPVTQCGDPQRVNVFHIACNYTKRGKRRQQLYSFISSLHFLQSAVHCKPAVGERISTTFSALGKCFHMSPWHRSCATLSFVPWLTNMSLNFLRAVPLKSVSLISSLPSSNEPVFPNVYNNWPPTRRERYTNYWSGNFCNFSLVCCPSVWKDLSERRKKLYLPSTQVNSIKSSGPWFFRDWIDSATSRAFPTALPNGSFMSVMRADTFIPNKFPALTWREAKFRFFTLFTSDFLFCHFFNVMLSIICANIYARDAKLRGKVWFCLCKSSILY